MNPVRTRCLPRRMREVPSRFIRVMVLPRALKGQSSIRYVLPEDADKPKTQQYRGYVDEFIEL